jgi:two-component system response regulator FixJ
MSESVLDSLTIYVVDDDDAVRDSLKILLESYGAGVEAFDSTGAFLRDYRPNSHACLLLDQHLPGATGLDFLNSREGTGLDLPIVLITGRGNEALRKMALEAGCSAYLEKPVDDVALVETIARVTTNRRADG